MALTLAVTGPVHAGPVALGAGPAALAVAEDFEGFAEAELPGSLAIRGGVISAAFNGQIIGVGASGNETVAGTPTDPLSLLDQPGAGNNIGILAYDSQVVYGNHDGEIGEGVLSILFSTRQNTFGLDIWGQNGGHAFFRFYDRNGGLIDALTVALADGVSESFAFTSSVDFAGVTITNDDVGGIAYDALRFDPGPQSVPEPTVLSLLGVALAGLALRRRPA